MAQKNKKKGSVFNRLYDPQYYTGVYAERFRNDGDGRINAQTDVSLRAGGLGFVGNTNTGSNEVIHDISSIMRPNLRTAFDQTHARRKDGGKAMRRFSAASGMWKDENGHAVHASGSTLHLSKDLPRELDTSEQLRHIFRYYCTFGRTGGRGAEQNTMDNSNFAKFCKESKLINRKSPVGVGAANKGIVTKVDVDLIFTKAKPKFERRLDFSHFLDALSAIASKKYPQYDAATAFSIVLAHHVFQNDKAPINAMRLYGSQAASPQRPKAKKQVQKRAAPPPPQQQQQQMHMQQTPMQQQPAPSFMGMASSQANVSNTQGLSSDELHILQLEQEAERLRRAHEEKMRHIQEKKRLMNAQYTQGTPPNQVSSVGAGSSTQYSQAQEYNPGSNAGGSMMSNFEYRQNRSGPMNATLAGEGNKPGGIYDRLSSPASFTGVYKQRLHGDGRINSHTELTARQSKYKGNTNTGTNEIFHDIKGMLRPNLRSKGGRFMQF
eukprot:g3046.t1